MGTNDYCKLFLWVPQLLLKAIYFWPRQKDTKTKKFFVFIIAALLFSFMNLGLIFQFSSTFNDLVKFASHVTIMTITFQATSKILVLYYNNKELGFILDDIMNKFWPYDLLETKVKHELKTFYHVILLIMISFTLVGATYGVMIMIPPYASRSFPFQVSYPFIDYTATPFYETIYFFQFCTILYLMYCVIVGCDFSFLGICSSVISQYKLLQNALLAFNTPEMEAINVKLRTIGQDELAEKNYSNHKEFFVRCIIHHHLLLGITQKMNRMFSSIEMVQLTCSMTGLCVGTFTLTSLENASFSTVAIILMFTVGYLNELFVYCAIGNELHYQASFLPEFIFKSDWNGYHNAEMTRDFMFMLQRSQDIPQLSAYNLYDINMDSYIRVIKLSFSVYTFLSKMKDK